MELSGLRAVRRQTGKPVQTIDLSFCQPLGPLAKHPLGFCLCTLVDRGFDLFNRIRFQRLNFEGRNHCAPLRPIFLGRDSSNFGATQSNKSTPPMELPIRGAVPTGAADVGSWVKTGIERHIVKPTRMTVRPEGANYQ
jgi:hypothetical protein